MLKIRGGYFGAIDLMPLGKTVQLVSGILLIANRYTNLDLFVLAPVLLVHLVADLRGILFGMIAGSIWFVLFINRWQFFQPIARATCK